MKNLDWLIENAGPIIRYRVLNEIKLKGTNLKQDQLLADMLSCGEVQKWMHLLAESKHIHGSDDYAMENSLAKLTAYGLTSDFCEISKLVESVYKRKFSNVVESDSGYQGILFPFFVALKHFNHKGVLSYALARLDTIYAFASESQTDADNREDISDWILSEQEKLALRIPRQWHDKTVWRPEISNLLPNCYDYYLFSFLDGHQEKRAAVLRFVHTPQFQKLCEQREFRRSYGWNAEKRYCWSTWEMPYMHGYHGFDSAKFAGNKFLLYMDLTSRFPQANTLAWFQNGLRYLENFRTEAGRYRFPTSFLPERKNGYYLYTGARMRLGEKGSLGIETESTFRMELMKSRTENCVM